MVFVLKPLTQIQQTEDDADQDYKHKGRLVICGNFSVWGEHSTTTTNQSRCSTLAIDAQFGERARDNMV